MIRLQTGLLLGALAAALLVTTAAEAQVRIQIKGQAQPIQVQIQAQPGRAIAVPGFRRGGGLDAMTLIRTEQVQKELKIADEQKEKVDALVASHREKSRGGVSFRNFRDLTQEERQKAFKEMQEKREKLNKESAKALAEILNKEQSTRLSQIQLQQKGVQALAGKDLQKKLKLSEEQTKGIASAVEDYNETRQKLYQEAREKGNFSAIREKSGELTKKRDAAVLGTLNEEQKAAFSKMKGEPFELDRRALFQRQPGRRPATARPAAAGDVERPKRPGGADKPEAKKLKKPEDK